MTPRRTTRSLLALVVASGSIGPAMGCSSDSFGSTAVDGGDDARGDDRSDGSVADGTSSDAGDASRPPFCASQSPPPRTCIDFDQTPPLMFLDGNATNLADPNVAPGGSTTFTAPGFSPPFAFSLTTPSTVDSGAGAVEGIDAAFTQKVTITQQAVPHAHLRFAMKLAAVTTPEQKTRVLAALRIYEPGGDNLFAKLFIDGGTAGIDLQGWATANYAYKRPQAPLFDTWTVIDLDVVVNGTNATAEVKYDGKAPTDGAVVTNVVTKTSSSASFFLGLDADSDLSPATVTYDDIALTTP